MIHVEIKEKKAVLLSFDTCRNEFDSEYERNKFFRGLHGWKQLIPCKSEHKTYTYRRQGLLDQVPHIKVADSAFIIAMKNLSEVLSYFESWKPKVEWRVVNITIEKRSWNRMIEEDK